MMQEFVQQVEETARAVSDEIHTALPGTVLAFDPDKGTAMVKPVGKYTMADGNVLEYPQISDVPVVFPFCQHTGVGMVFPLHDGDGCLLIVSEVELDEWRTGAQAEGALRFDLTSAVCIPGLLRGGNGLAAQAAREEAVIIASQDTYIAVSKSGIAIRGDLTVNGNIISTGAVKAGKIDLQSHVHPSANPGENTGKPQ